MSFRDFKRLASIEQAQAIELAPPLVKRWQMWQNRLTLLMIIVIASGVGVVSYYFTRESSTPAQNNFYELPEIFINLAQATDSVSHLKLKLTLVIDNEQTRRQINNQLPLINDILITFLKELRVVDLMGSGGTIMIKAEMLKRINKILGGTQVIDILFGQFLID